MKIFYGAAIQGTKCRNERAYVHSALIAEIRNCGHCVFSEHTTGTNPEETAELLEKAIGPLPPKGMERTIYVRRRMIEAIEGDINAAVFEVSTPSLGTGMEIVHAYNRSNKGLPPVPILSLYQKDYWPGSLSSMIRGITADELPNFKLAEYADLDDARRLLRAFIESVPFD